MTGYSQTADGSVHAFLYTPAATDCPARLLDLGVLRGPDSHGLAVNAAGVVVGQDAVKQPGDSRAIIIAPGLGIVDLNTLLPSGAAWKLLRADSIDDRLIVTGDGLRAGEDTQWTPARFEVVLESVVPMPSLGCCAADFDADDAVTAADLHAYMAAFFESLPTADQNADGAVTTDDFYLYMQRYLAGCP